MGRLNLVKWVTLGDRLETTDRKIKLHRPKAKLQTKHSWNDSQASQHGAANSEVKQHALQQVISSR